ncbi:MAG: DegV family EDD domain-containing protein [Oscillospiraceae bacterium]|nr:DegV family EDD domain-containing protein [Oscillospiraceae bacterium]
MSHITLVAETGSDVPAALAQELGIRLVPMHVSLGDQTKDDGTFPPEEVCAYYDRTGKVPTTSGSTPYDFEQVFQEIFRNDPEARVLYLAYSAVTTCSYHSAELALEDKPYASRVALVDTKQVSVGQGAVVLAMAKWLETHPEATLEEAAKTAENICNETRMCFIPKNLDYLRAGGRCSNAVALVGNLLNLHPCIEIIDGRLIAGKKYRGALTKLAPQLLREFTEKNQLKKDHLYFIETPYMEEAVRTVLDAEAKAMGFENVTWIKTGCVITCHGGAGAFGIVGRTNN